MYKYLWIVVFCLGLLASTEHRAIAQASNDTEESTGAKRNITSAEWKELTNDEYFSYRDKVENKKLPKKQNNSAFGKFLKSLAAFLSSTAGKVLIWGLLILVVGYAVYRLVIGERSSIFGRSSRKQGEEVTAVVEDINETNWEKLLDEAAKAGNLRLAVRYSYMLLLQMLERSELIQYRQDKTNYQYASELADTSYKQPFRQLSRQYEYTWYGNFPISENSYAEYIDTLMTLKNKLGR